MIIFKFRCISAIVVITIIIGLGIHILQLVWFKSEISSAIFAVSRMNSIANDVSFQKFNTLMEKVKKIAQSDSLAAKNSLGIIILITSNFCNRISVLENIVTALSQFLRDFECPLPYSGVRRRGGGWGLGGLNTPRTGKKLF